MPRLALNKSELTRQAALLKTFRQFLPSLELKRRQLLRERARARQALAATRREIAATMAPLHDTLAMLADQDVDLKDLVTVQRVTLREENIVGTTMPLLQQLEVKVSPYSLLAKPHWVDRTAAILDDRLRLHVREQVDARRVHLLERAVRTVTQRVNLFEKVLIPRTESNIKRIRIYLADADRTAVVRAKLAKRNRQQVR